MRLHMKEKLKKQYFAQKFNIHQSDRAHTWNLVNKLMDMSHTKYTPNLITCPLTQTKHLTYNKSAAYSINTSNELAQIWLK